MVDVLRVKRGQIKGKLTRFKNFIDSIEITKLEEIIVVQLYSRLEKIELIFEEFNELQSQIEIIDDTDSNIEREQFENNFFSIIAQAKKILSIHENQNAMYQAQASNFNKANNSMNNIQIQNNTVKLPTIKLPSFDGKYSNWMEYRDAFKALVDSNESLSKIQKFYYLRSSLESEASQIIKAIEVASDNYIVAWKLLEDRYENKKLIIHNHIRAIFELQGLTKESHYELRNLYDTVTKHLRSLKALGENTDSWDRLIIYIMSNKFDNITRRDWESYKYENDLPDMKDMNSFLKNKCEILEKLELNKQEKIANNKSINQNQKKHSNSFVSINKMQCFYCNKNHGFYNCESFLKLPTNQRIIEVKKRKLCLNCLGASHSSWQCKKQGCRKCGKPHNSLLHLEFTNIGNQNNQNINISEPMNSSTAENQLVAAINSRSGDYSNEDTIQSEESRAYIVNGDELVQRHSQILLSTVSIRVRDVKGTFHNCRALLDSGSQSHFISRNLCNKLGYQITNVNFVVKGVGQALQNINQQVNIPVMCHFNDFTINVNCLVLPIITDKIPLIPFNKNQLKIPNHLKLADPNFNKSGDIDVLLGASVFWSLLCVGQIKLGEGLPILQKTVLGWVVAGNLHMTTSRNESLSFLSTNKGNIDQQISKFWKVEEVEVEFDKLEMLQGSEKFCEQYFQTTTRRDETGRFIVSIPFNSLLKDIGDSEDIAKNRFFHIEKKLNRDRELKKGYSNFMFEYRELGHMSKIDEISKRKSIIGNYYLPHHCILKPTSITSKYRVVFDGSAKSSSGISLNDAQFKGPIIQNEIFPILLRFRKYRYVITGDVSKMYRQILIDPKQRCMQRIFWRSSPDLELECFELNTVTYGTASAPWLAVRCLHQLALDNKDLFPRASEIIKNDFYMDDLLTGADSITEIIRIQKEISSILVSAGFELRKWLSNEREVLNQIEINEDVESGILCLGEEEHNKILGVLWKSNQDSILYSIRDFNEVKKKNITKRSILSLICRIYDPLGLLGPVIIIAKLIIQKLWKLKYSWDQLLSQDLISDWNQFERELHQINHIQIPRFAFVENYISVEMHGFSDASERGYGACVYVRSLSTDGKYVINLLCAKSRVAPIKQLSIPKLELCGALLLARLSKNVFNSIRMKFDKQFYWTDSMITLAWIKGSANNFKTFVANRIGEIQSLTETETWYHVKSIDNPADLLSRGVNSGDLINSDLWWHGPNFLKSHESEWQIKKNISPVFDLPERKLLVNVNTQTLSLLDLFNTFSKLKTLKRTVAYIFRFIKNCRVKNPERISGPISPTELQNSLNILLKSTQMECFPKEYFNLSNKLPLPNSSKILSLSPFIDGVGLMRVGGRIKNVEGCFDKKHPVLLPKHHNMTKLIFLEEHERQFHCGQNHLLYTVRESYWPIAGRSIARDIVRKCIVCFRVKPYNSDYLMGNLPRVRLTPSIPFSNVGVDYGGPFLLKTKKGKGAKIIKAYMCLFICMSTKAIHLEPVSDLTTDSFIMTLKRFIARRGKPLHIYSDNGSNFVGTNNEISKLFEFVKEESNYFENYLADKQIHWHFIPAKSPNFGGIWEAGIKSSKHHLKRVVGSGSLTFEEFATVLVQIESILNSRPISPMSSDPEDLSALTPGHFLIGRPMTSLPEPNYNHIPTNRLNKFQALQNMIQHYWHRWYKEFISELQIRNKWKQNSKTNLSIGTLVLLKDDNIPPMNWKLGRIEQLHPGQDGIVRVVSVKITSGIIKRSVRMLCALPID